MCIFHPNALTVCSTSVGVWSEGESLEECVVTELEKGRCVFFIATYGGLKRSEEARELLPEFLSLFTNMATLAVSKIFDIWTAGN